MNAFAPINAYAVGAGLLGLGLHATLRPGQRARPTAKLDAPPDRHRVWRPHLGPKASSAVPFVSGLALIALQYAGNTSGVTHAAAAVALATLGEGFRVRGEREHRREAWFHWTVSFGLACWAGWRLFLGYGEWAAFYALHV